jgi:hypothetical protein
VTLKDGLARPISVRSVLVVSPAGDTLGRSRKAAGRPGEVALFVLKLPAGDYVVEVMAEGFKSTSRTLSMHVGEESEWDIHLSPADDAGEFGDEAEREARALEDALGHFTEMRTGSRDKADFPADARQKALEQKRRMSDSTEGAPTLRVTAVTSPLVRVSFGSLERYVDVDLQPNSAGPHALQIPYSEEDLGYVDPSTLRIFQIDADRRTASLVEASGVDTENRIAFAQIARPGVYGIFGLPEHPAVLQAVRMFCRLDDDRPASRDRICDLILCQPELGDLRLPGRIDGNICDQCTQMTLLEGGLPERQILERPKALPSGLVAGACSWLFIGPRNVNGRVRALASHPTVGGTVFAGTAAAGVWITRDRGQSWRPCMHREYALEIGALATHPNPGGGATVYAGTGEPFWSRYRGVGIYRSTKSGAPGSWTLCGPICGSKPCNERYAAIVVDPSSITAGPAKAVVYAGGTPGGLYRSSDGGATWTSLLAKPISGLALDPTNPSIVYAAVSEEGIFRLVNGVWSPFNTGLLKVSAARLVAIAIGSRTPHTMYCKLGETVYRYDAVRTTWEALGDYGGDTCGDWNMALGVDPHDSKIVYAGGLEFWRSHDEGKMWRKIPGLHVDQHAICFDAGKPFTTYLGNDGGVFRGEYASAGAGGSWAKRSDGLLATALNHVGAFPGSGDIVGGGAQDNGTLRTVGGLTWDEISGDDGGFLVIDPADPYILYAENQEATKIRKTTNGGQTWSLANRDFPGGPWVTPIVMDGTSPKEPLRTLFAGGTNNVFSSRVSPPRWVTSSPVIDGAVNAIAIAPSSSAVLYAGSGHGQVWRSTDGGLTSANWKDVTASASGSATLPARAITDVAVHPKHPATFWVAFSGFGGGHIFRGLIPPTGATLWDDVSANLPDTPVNAIQVNPTDSQTLYIGTDVGVFRTVDGGLSWHVFDASLPNVIVSDLAINASGTRLRAATYGWGMWKLRLTGTCPAVDLYVRDNVRDTGEVRPSPSNVVDPTALGRRVYWWESADIKVDAHPYYPVDALFDGVGFDRATHQTPTPQGAAHPHPNRLYVQVHNRGPIAARDVKVKALFADASLGPPSLPSDFWSRFPHDWTATSPWSTIDPAVPFQNIPELLPHTPKVLSWSWTLPSSPSQEKCILLVVSAPADPVARRDTGPNNHNPSVIVPHDKHITLHNLHLMTVPAPPANRIPQQARVTMNNAFGHEEFFDLEIDRTWLQETARLSIVLPTGITLRVPAEELRQQGVPIDELNGREWFATQVKLAPEDWLYHVTVPANADPSRPVTRVRGILVLPDEPVTVLIVLELPDDVKLGERSRVSVIQRRGKQIVGGSTYEVQVAPRAVPVR